jgi:AAA+ ATPase superfamily predicted ATPase
LILGSLQLLFWIFFRPSAWRNHLKRVDPALDIESQQKSQWRSRNPALWRLLIQGFLMVPFLINLTLGLVLWVLGEPVEKIALEAMLGVVSGIVCGVVFGVVFHVIGVASGVALGVALSVAFGVALGVALGVASGVALGVASGVASGVALGLVSVVTSVAASVVALGVASGVALGVGTILNVSRPVVLYPFLMLWNKLLYQLDKRLTGSKSSLLHWHSAFWDEWQFIPLYGLDKHLLLVIECYPFEGQAAINYLNTSRQRWAVQSVQIELDIRSLERCKDVKAIRQVHRKLEIGEIETPISPKLRLTSRISEDVDAALNQESAYNQRLALRYIADRIDLHLQEFNRSNDKYAPRFYLIAKTWHQIITKYIEELAKETELRQEIDSPYIIGVPLTQQQEIFTGRNDIGTRIEQLLLDRRRPPLLLYGQRRMGKTSLLNNLGKLLPNSIIPMFVDLQGAPSSASNYAGFLYNLARGMITSAKRQSALTLPSLTREELEKDAFTSFDEWLDKVEQALQDNTALLSLDEFEVLDSAITKGRFDEEDVLGMLRNLIQHRPKFKVLIAGSHTIQEYQRWASYLINVQVVHISYLKEDEARQLIEHPVKDFTLRYESDAVERVLQLTRCHPFLVQLLCAEIVALKNEQNPSVRRLANLADVEAGIPAAFSSGGFFFADIQNNQVDAAGLAILRFIAALGEGAIVSRKALSQEFPDVGESTFNLLLQRELIEEVGEGYGFQVELIRRWFVKESKDAINRVSTTPD